MRDRKSTCAAALLTALITEGATAQAADLTIDRATTYQTIEGFGFFGAADVWWSSASAVLDQAWTEKVIDDLGITMWRNEYYAAGTPQDATWDKQKPVVQALVKYAAQRGVKLKILLTAWSPPAALKCLSDDDDTCSSNPPTRPSDTKGGNILDPAKRGELADWFIAGAQLYRDAGADLYAISFQNEPLFVEPYNSCVYSTEGYAETLAAIGPPIKAAFPDVKLFGSENMLGTECGKSPGTAFDPYWYTAHIMENPTALAAIDAFAVHGYVDGVSATATSKLASMWTSFRTGTASTGKAIWMTETSGYTHTWPGTSSSPGPLDLGQAIYASLAYGNLSAWTYWQGSEKDGYTEYSLMAGANSPGKNYYVSKQFFRYLRPGAQRVDLKSNDPEVMAVAFEHAGMNAFTIVMINAGSASKTITLVGAGLPADFQAFRTSAKEDTVALGTVAAGEISLPASSITTFVNGSYRETEGAGGTGGAGGAPGTGGATGSGGRGGATGTAGRTGSGGATAMGGVTGTGGRVGSSGATGAGGRTGSGGAGTGGAATGGRTAGGGSPGTGGVSASGGSTSTGGAVSTGGTPGGTGGDTAGGGGAGGTTTSVAGGSGSGCSCRMGGGGAAGFPWWTLLVATIAILAARRDRRSTPGRKSAPARWQPWAEPWASPARASAAGPATKPAATRPRPRATTAS